MPEIFISFSSKIMKRRALTLPGSFAPHSVKSVGRLVPLPGGGGS